MLATVRVAAQYAESNALLSKQVVLELSEFQLLNYYIRP